MVDFDGKLVGKYTEIVPWISLGSIWDSWDCGIGVLRVFFQESSGFAFLSTLNPKNPGMS